MRVLTSALLMLLLVPMLPSVSAQDPSTGLYDFEIEAPFGPFEVPVNGQAIVEFTFRDLSRDTPTAYVPNSPEQVPIEPHILEFELSGMLNDTTGWVALPIPGTNTFAQQEYTFRARVTVTNQATNPFYQLNLTSVSQTRDGEFRETASILFFTKGIAGFTPRSTQSLELEPREIATGELAVRNTGSFPRTYMAEVADNPCNLRVAPPGTFSIEGKQETRYSFSVQGPEDRAWYLTEDCTVMIDVWAADNPSLRKTAVVSVVVDGFYIDPVWVFWTVAAALALLLIVLFVKRRKERIEEEILGKPQKPWLIPVEKVYLDRLKEKDERSWYMVRHYLMEEEYRSALLWYEAEKKGTRASREKERLVLRLEHRYKKWQQAWEKKIEAPIRQADRLEDKLQKKLDRAARKRFKKLKRAHAKEVAKLQAAHEAQKQKALGKWEKQAAKAEKKGRPAPEKPVFEPPVLPDEPTPEAPDVEDSKYAKRLERARLKAERQQGDLEVKYEKADAKYRAQMVRKARRLAKKIDDPDFVEEHPLLRDARDA